MTTKQTPVQAAGISIGDTFKVLVDGDGDYYHRYDVGDIIELVLDDGSDNPKFKRLSDGKEQFMRLNIIEQINLTPAVEAGLVIGTTYRMKDGNSEGYPAGTLVTFTEDDGTRYPRFDVPRSLDSDGWNFLRVADVEPVPARSVAVEFDDTVVTVPIEITIITVKRRLTQAEKDAISAIIN